MGGRTLLLAGSACKGLGGRISGQSKMKQVDYEGKRFPDSSFYAKLANPASISGEDVAVVQSCITDQDIMELLVLEDMLKEAGAGKVVTVAPYFGGYARQDRPFQPGEPISARALSKLFQAYSEVFITVDAHSDQTMNHFDIPAMNLSPAEAMADYLQAKKVDWVIAPDAGAKSRANRVASIMNVHADYIKKKRIDSYTVEMDLTHIDVDGKVVAVIDDIISTGGTMIKASQELRKKGARRVYALCTHGLFGVFHQGIIQNLKEFDVVCTDTIQTELSEVTVAGVIADALRQC
jgi:ribose-phosphate pyrophosphokinase